MLDLVVRNAIIYDGSGMPPFLGEVGVKSGRLVRVGRVPERGDVEVDAAGHAVAPGFITPTSMPRSAGTVWPNPSSNTA
jgi:N-acyl-D-amino-acid deacylase